MKHFLAACIVVLMVLGSAAPASAQQRPTAVDSIRTAYERLDYEQAAERAHRVLDNYRDYSQGQLGEVYVMLGAIQFAQGNQQEARNQFKQALSLRPNLELSTLRYSPKILQFFQSVKKDFKQDEPSEEADLSDETSVRYIIKEDARPQAALRSAVLPGAGQLYKGETVKGWALVVLWGGALAGADLVDAFRQQAKRDYLDAGRGNTEAPYERYNTWHKTAEGMRLAAAALWLYGVTDALLNRRQSSPAQAARWQLRAPASGRAGLSLHVHF